MMKTRLIVFTMMLGLVLACSKDEPTPTPQSQNSLPVANAGDDQKVVIGSTVKINASSSSDPDGDNLTFSWLFIAKPDGSTATIIGAGQAGAEFIMDRAGSYEIELKVSDGLLDVSDKLLVTNRTPIINRVDAQYGNFTNVEQPKEQIRLFGDFFSPDVSENSIFIADIKYEILDLEVNSDGGDEDFIAARVPENAISGELKMIIGDELVSWKDPIRILGLPVKDFVAINEHLEEQQRSDGNVPDTYFEIGTRFVPKADGEVLGFRLRTPEQGNYEVNLWDVEAKLRIGFSIVDIQHDGGSIYEVILPQGIALKSDKEYVVSYNSNNWYLHIDEQDGQANQFPKIIANVEIIGTAFHSGHTPTFPDDGFPVNFIVNGADVIFAADPQ